jgi:O-antigen/teichoic acid export membrane protein
MRTLASSLLVRSANQSHERYRRAFLTGVTAAGARSVSLAASLVTVRLTLDYLGQERYGMWMTISSTITMFGIADFGMSNGLINHVATALGKGDRTTARKVISSALGILTLIALAMGALLLVLYPFLNLARLFNVHSPLALREAAPTFLALAGCFLVSLPLGVIRGTQNGMQDGALTNLWVLTGTIASLLCLLGVMHLHGGLPLLVLGLTAPPLIALLVNGFFMFTSGKRDLIPSPKVMDWATCQNLLHTGGLLFVIQVAIAIGMQSDNIVIAQIMGASAVALYAVPAKLFNTVNSILIMLSASLWPAYAEALARNDRAWIRRTFRRVTIAGTISTVVIAGGLVLFGRQIIAAWVGPKLVVSESVLLVFGLQCIVYAYLQPVGFLLNGLSRYRIQAWCAALMAILNLALSILFVKHFGILGAVLGTTVAQVVVQVIPLTIAAKSELSKIGTAEGI